MAVIKSKQRNYLQLELYLVLAVSNVSPRIEKLMSRKKAHVSTEKVFQNFYKCLHVNFEFWSWSLKYKNIFVCAPGIVTCDYISLMVCGIWPCFEVVFRQKNFKSTDL
jgi:hypothetical protein